MAVSYGMAELLSGMVEAFGAPRPTSFGLGELLEDLIIAIENFSTIVGGFTTLQLGNPSIDNAIQINDILQLGLPILNNQLGVCYISQPIVVPPGLGIWTPFTASKNGGNFYVGGLRIMAAPGFSGSISTFYQNQYGLPPTMDALVVMPGLSSWLSGVVVDGSTSPSVATPAHQFPVALYNTDITIRNSEIRQATTPGAAIMDIGELGNSQGSAFTVALPSISSVVYVPGSPPNMQINFSSNLGPYMAAAPSANTSSWGLNMSGVTGIGHAIPPNPINIFNDVTGPAQITLELNTLTTGLTVTSPSATVQFNGAARFSMYATNVESGTGFALDLGGVDTKIVGGRKQQGLVVYNCQGLDLVGQHLTGQGGTQTVFGNTGEWNTVVAARGQMVKAIFDTIPGGSSGLIGYMNNDPNDDPFVFDSCEYHMNNPSVTNVPIVNRITSGGGQHGTAPLQIVAGSAYANSTSIFASPTVGLGGLIDRPVAGDMVTELISTSDAWVLGGAPPNPTVAELFGTGTVPVAYSIDFGDVPLWLSNITGSGGGGFMPGVVANDPTTDYGPIINTYMATLASGGDTLPLPQGIIYTATTIVPPQGVILVGSGWAEDITQEGTSIQPQPGVSSPTQLILLNNPESGFRNLNVDGLAHNVTGTVNNPVQVAASKCRATSVGLYGGSNTTLITTSGGEGFQMNNFRCDTMAAGPGPAGSTTLCCQLQGSDALISNGVMANGTKLLSGDQTLWNSVHFTSASGGALGAGTNANVCDQGGQHFSSCEFDSLPASPTIPLTAMIDRTGATFPSTYASCRVMQSTASVTGMPVFLETTHAAAGAVISGMTLFKAAGATGSTFTNFMTGAVASTQVDNVTLPASILSSTFTDVIPPAGAFMLCSVGGVLQSLGGSIPGSNLIVSGSTQNAYYSLVTYQ